MGEAKHTPGLIKALVLAYRRHEAWARRSGFAPMDWQDFKHSRQSNPLALAALAQRPESAHPAIRLTRIDGMCVVALCIDGREVPVIQDNGDFISHYVEPLGIAQALKRYGITKPTKGDAR